MTMRFANEYGYYELTPFPGNNFMVVSNNAFIYPHYRGKGHGQTQHKERLAKARELGYSAIVCTVNKNNAAEIHILEQNGWTRCGDIYNRNLDEYAHMYHRGL